MNHNDSGRATRSRARTCAALVAMGAFAPAALHAQPKPQPQPTAPTASAAPAPSAPHAAAVTTPPIDEATALFKKGIAAHDAGKLAEAEELFTKAWALKKTWDIAANLGLVESRLGKHATAATHLAYAARMVPPTEPAASTAELTKLLAAERSEVGVVKVHANVDGAEVRVGGELKGTTPLDGELFVTPGTVTIDVQADGYEPVRKTVDVAKGGSVEATLMLVRKASPERSKLPVYVLGGAGVVAAGVGAGLLGAYAGKRDDAAALNKDILAAKHSCVADAANFDARCKDVESAARAGDALNRAGIGLLIGGGALAAGALAWWLWPQDKTRATSARIVPIVSNVGGGFVASGSW